MTLHTPVVFTDDEAVARIARERHWPVVRRDGDHLMITGFAQLAPLPEERMDIAAGSLSTAATADGWKFVLDWVAKYVHKPMPVVLGADWAGDLAAWASASRGWPHHEPSDITDLPDAALLEVQPPLAPSASGRTPGKLRVLLVSPNPHSPRLSTWAGVDSSSLRVDLATTQQEQGWGRVHVVPDHGVAGIAPDGVQLEPVSALLLQRAADSAYEPVLQESGTWQLALERYFEARDDHYDIVVLSAPPAAYFGFAAWAQRNWYARTVLDWASLEPGDTPEEDRARRYWERGWSMAADVVTAPTADVAAAVPRNGPDTCVEVLATGDNQSAAAVLMRLANPSASAAAAPSTT